ncbi:MAG: ATP-binding cassette domain-containing protein [Propionibacteriaceae bacterium]
MTKERIPLLELVNAGKSYGNVEALRGVSLVANSGEVTCVLGDNGAGKSTLIKIISGLHRHTSGELLIGGVPTVFSSPRDAQAVGIATVHQDLALAPLMAVWRNFFLGNELTKRPFGRLDITTMKEISGRVLDDMGVVIPDLETPVGSLSGGQRQCVAIARAIHFGAKVLVLDEPTAALGVKQSGVVLRHIAAARDAGIAVIFITHNPQHAWLVGDHFVVLKLGRVSLDGTRDRITIDQLTTQMAGGDELAALMEDLVR